MFMEVKIDANQTSHTICVPTTGNSMDTRKGPVVEIIICFLSILVANISGRAMNIITPGTTKFTDRVATTEGLETLSMTTTKK